MQAFVILLKKWQKTINLVSCHALEDVWYRHIVDSMQLYSYIEERDRVIDIGSGAGFPGMILALMGVSEITLVESDKRKAAFLQKAAQLCKTRVIIKNARAETLSLVTYTTITARAFAPLEGILKMLSKNLKSNHKLLLLKGENYGAEIVQAEKNYRFEYAVYPSLTHRNSVVMAVGNITGRRA